MAEEREVQLPRIPTRALDPDSIRELNYRVRKTVESLMVASNSDSEFTSRITNIYFLLGENYQIMSANPDKALSILREAVEELKALINSANCSTHS